MSQHNLDDQLREHYARKQLDAVKLRALEAQLACAPRRWAAWGWAAAAAAACVLVFWGLSAREGLAGALADEIARKPLEQGDVDVAALVDFDDSVLALIRGQAAAE